MTSLRAAQICQRSKATRPAMSRLSEQHMSKTKSAKLFSVSTCVCSTVEVLPNTNPHAPPYNPQKHANHPQQLYHTRDRPPHIVHASRHTPCKSSLTNYVLYERNSPSRFYVTLLQHGTHQCVTTERPNYD